MTKSQARMGELTIDERAAIRTLEQLAKNWPKTLWLFSGSGSLWVMRYGPGGTTVVTDGGGMDPAAGVAHIDIPNDGGDW